MKQNFAFTIVGCLISIVIILLWHFEIIGEPVYALSGPIITLTGIAFTNKRKMEADTKSTKIIQKNLKGDNIARDKITYK